MANETTYALISSFIPDIWEAALMYAQDEFVMTRLVETFSTEGWQDRKFTEYVGGTISTAIAEAGTITEQPFNRGSLATLTPAEIGHAYAITDRRMETDDVMSIMADASADIGYQIFKQVESDLAGDMANFTAGTIGSAGGTLTWEDVLNARSILAATAVPGPYTCVLHEYQYRRLANAANIAGLSNAGYIGQRDQIQSNYYVGSFSNIEFYVVGNAALSAGTAVSAGMFNRQAIAYDVRRGLRFELDRYPKERKTILVASHGYAHGNKRTAFGVTLLGDASAPS